MTQLSGSLEGIGLVALLDFLSSVSTTGRLIVVDGDLHGTLDLEFGALVGAVLEHEQGLPALEGIALALGGGRFELLDITEPDRNLLLSRADLSQELAELMRERVDLQAAIPSLAAIPRALLEEDGGDDSLAVDRDALRLLVRLDGHQSVAQLARHEGLTRTLRLLMRLVDLRLAKVESRMVEPRPMEATQAPGERAAHEAPAEEGPRLRPVPRSPSVPPSPARQDDGSKSPAWSRWRRPTPSAS